MEIKQTKEGVFYIDVEDVFKEDVFDDEDELDQIEHEIANLEEDIRTYEELYQTESLSGSFANAEEYKIAIERSKKELEECKEKQIYLEHELYSNYYM